MDLDKSVELLPVDDPSKQDEFLLRLNVEKYLDLLDQSVSLEADERQHLSALLHSATQDTFKKPKLDSRQLSEALLGNTALTLHEKEAVIKFQRQAATSRLPGDFALGNILVANGQITRPQLEEALRQQAKSGRFLGEELITAGHLSLVEVNKSLLLQRKLIACALAVTASLAPIVSTTAEAAQTSTAMTVSVTVVAHAKLQTVFQATQLRISNDDVARGYVEVHAASRFSVVSNSRSGYLMQFLPLGNLFDSVQIRGLGNAVQMGTDGGVVVQRGLLSANPVVELSFRFVLSPYVAPGNYPWPLQLSVHSL